MKHIKYRSVFALCAGLPRVPGTPLETLNQVPNCKNNGAKDMIDVFNKHYWQMMSQVHTTIVQIMSPPPTIPPLHLTCKEWPVASPLKRLPQPSRSLLGPRFPRCSHRQTIPTQLCDYDPPLPYSRVSPITKIGSIVQALLSCTNQNAILESIEEYRSTGSCSGSWQPL